MERIEEDPLDGDRKEHRVHHASPSALITTTMIENNEKREKFQQSSQGRAKSGVKIQTSSSKNNSSPVETNGKQRGDDLWDDYCYVCSQGCDETTGSLGCCESCPKVFHPKCHVPAINGAMEDLP